jgi:outer membrane lipoprotein-sorting protein
MAHKLEMARRLAIALTAAALAATATAAPAATGAAAPAPTALTSSTAPPAATAQPAPPAPAAAAATAAAAAETPGPNGAASGIYAGTGTGDDTDAAAAQRILAASDAVRNPKSSFALTNTLTEYHNGRATDTSTLEIYARADALTGQYRNLIRFAAPARDQDKLMLKNGNDLWFYDPSSQASVRISPRQRLLGQAANGDVVTVNLAKDYRAELGDDTEVEDGDRIARHCHLLRLTAGAADVTYDHIEMWIDVASSRPVKAKFYAESGQLLKTAYYRRYQRELDAERPTETVIIDGLDHAWVTIMRYSDYAWRDVPETWLQRDYLPRFKPQ